MRGNFIVCYCVNCEGRGRRIFGETNSEYYFLICGCLGNAIQRETDNVYYCVASEGLSRSILRGIKTDCYCVVCIVLGSA